METKIKCDNGVFEVVCGLWDIFPQKCLNVDDKLEQLKENYRTFMNEAF